MAERDGPSRSGRLRQASGSPGRAGQPQPGQGAALRHQQAGGVRAWRVGIDLSPQAVLCPSLVERFVICGRQEFSAPTAPDAANQLPRARPCPRRLARPSCQSLLPRESAKTPYTGTEISAFLALADAQPTPERPIKRRPYLPRGGGGPCPGPTWALPGHRCHGPLGRGDQQS